MRKKFSLIIFTDLDGSLLHRETFKFDPIKDYIKNHLKIKDYEIIEYPKEKTAFEIILEDLEKAQQFRGKTIEDVYISQFKKKLSKMQGIQALLPIEYQID